MRFYFFVIFLKVVLPRFLGTVHRGVLLLSSCIINDTRAVHALGAFLSACLTRKLRTAHSEARTSEVRALNRLREQDCPQRDGSQASRSSRLGGPGTPPRGGQDAFCWLFVTSPPDSVQVCVARKKLAPELALPC